MYKVTFFFEEKERKNNNLNDSISFAGLSIAEASRPSTAVLWGNTRVVLLQGLPNTPL